MGQEALHQLVGMAVIDRDFERRLLTHPREVLVFFELLPEERAAILGIKARSLDEFSRQLNAWAEEHYARNGHRHRALWRNGEIGRI